MAYLSPTMIAAASGRRLLLPFVLLGVVSAKFESATIDIHGECSSNDGSCEPEQGGSNNDGAPRTLYDKEEDCVDILSDCDSIVSARGSVEDACIPSFSYMRTDCRKTCLMCDNWEDDFVSNLYSEEAQQVSADAMEYLAKVDDYMYNKVFVESEYRRVRTNCKNRHEHCIFWATLGECEKNPSYMKMQCAAACLTCDQLLFEKRCPFDKDAPTIWSKPGDLNSMFTRIVTEPEFQQYNVTVLSQPEPPAAEDGEESTIQKGPWVVVLDDFLTAEEADTLRDLGAERGYERSQDVGEAKFDGSYGSLQSEGRTSTNAWCTESCWEHNVSKTVHDRIHNLLQIPPDNYEYLQLLKYQVGQFYEVHHDYIEHHLERSPGVRIMTVFLYLNDVEEGGGTNFPKLNLTVEPKQGRVLLWPSVLDEDPNKKDFRTDHQALPVIAGIKYGANAWVHQRDFKDAWKKSCH